MTSATSMRSFSVDLPEGMVPIPMIASAGSATALAEALAGRFGLRADDVSAVVVADLFTVFGEMMGESGVEFAAMGLFRSPDDPERPASVFMTGMRIASDHESPEVAIRGLRELHTGRGADAVETITLPAGPAVVVVDESMRELSTRWWRRTGGGVDPSGDGVDSRSWWHHGRGRVGPLAVLAGLGAHV